MTSCLLISGRALSISTLCEEYYKYTHVSGNYLLMSIDTVVPLYELAHVVINYQSVSHVVVNYQSLIHIGCSS
jgi:hypothetical protein